MQNSEALRSALNAVTFEPDELAYLALTSKPELQVRDRLAWRLLRSAHVAGREWKRADLVLLNEDYKPRAVLEAKAAYTADLHQHPTAYRKDIINDMRKAYRLAPQAEAFALVVVTHVHNPVPRSMHNLVKYGRLLSRVADREKADANLRASLELLGPIYRRALGTGTAFGLRASVDAWLCGPISPQVPRSGAT